MTNLCQNQVVFSHLDESRLLQLEDYLKGDEPVFQKEPLPKNPLTSVFSLHKLIPIPPSVLAEAYHPSGLEWQKKEWGVKWGTLEAECEGLDTEPLSGGENPHTLRYTFQTPWREPVPIIEILSRLFPDIGFTWSYMEPDMLFFGYWMYTPGEKLVNQEYAVSDEEDLEDLLARAESDEAPEDIRLAIEDAISYLEEEEDWEDE